VPEWRPGDLVIGRYDLTVEGDAPSGVYQVWVGIYDRRTMERLPLLGAAGRELNLGLVRVVGRPVEEATIPERLEVSFEEDIILVGFGSERQGSELEVTLYWRADHPLGRDYTVFVQLLDSTGRLVAQADSPPARGSLPTSLWIPGELIADKHSLSLASLAPGRYQLITGLYILESGQRQRTEEGRDSVALFSLELGRVE